MPSSIVRRRLRVYHSELTGRVEVGSGRKEELVGISVRGRSSTEFDGPQPGDADRGAARVLDGADQFPCCCAEGIDPAVVDVPHQQRVAERTEVRRC